MMQNIAGRRGIIRDYWRDANGRATQAYVDPKTVRSDYYDAVVNPGARSWFEESAVDLIAITFCGSSCGLRIRAESRARTTCNSWLYHSFTPWIGPSTPPHRADPSACGRVPFGTAIFRSLGFGPGRRHRA